MDSDSIGDRLKELQLCKIDDVDNTNESVEEGVPEILSSEVRDVFHIFASMLDVKSFVKLAMTSKKMYKRCMEDTEIKIDIDMDRLDASNTSGSVEFVFLPDVPYRHHDDFIAALRKFPCKVNLRTLQISDILKPEISVVSEVLQHMKEIGVNKIHELDLYHDDNEWETIFAIIKDFDVKTVIHREYKEDILRSFLQLNLEKLTQYGPVPVDFILEIDSPIQEIFFPDVVHISREQLIDILEKIQSGSLHRLTFWKEAVQWNDFYALPFDHKEPLPDDRPLLLEKTTNEENYYGYTYYPKGFDEYWFLHWHGGVTKCVVDDYLEIFKCEPWDYPWILRKEEDILNDLAEKRPRISCSANQFNTFCKSLTMIDYNKEGSLPNDRPLYFKIPVYFKSPENNFWMLGEDDNLMKCTWEGGFATWMSYDPSCMAIYQQPALSKYMFWKVLKQVEEGSNFSFHCDGIQQFNSWFEDCEMLDFEYSGVLPSSRPLVFERASSEPEQSILRVVLFEDRLLYCEYTVPGVYIQICHYLNRPLILFSANNVLEMLQDTHLWDAYVNVHYGEFLDGLNHFKTSSFVLQKRILITELVADEFWYWMEDVKRVKKVAWKDKRLSLIVGDLSGSPSDFMKQVFKHYAEGESVTLELEEFRSCLEQFTVVPYDYSGPLTSDSPLAFVKNDIRHTFCNKDRCQCSEVCIIVWLLWDGKKVKRCSWGENKPKEVRFGTYLADVPPVFKTKDYLKFLLQEDYDKSTRFKWFGSAEDFSAFFEDHMKLPFDYDGPLPEERPLLFEKDKYSHSQSQFLLRADGTVIECAFLWLSSSVELFLSTYNDYHVPRALKSML